MLERRDGAVPAKSKRGRHLVYAGVGAVIAALLGVEVVRVVLGALLISLKLGFVVLVALAGGYVVLRVSRHRRRD